MYTVRPGLLCWEKSSQQKREHGNSEDPFAVRLKRGGETVGHVSREISKICWLFIRRGSLTAEVTLCKMKSTEVQTLGTI